MIEITKLDLLIIRTLNRIDDTFFRIIYGNIDEIKRSLDNRNGEFVENEFHNYGERIFCYELYHQLRLEEKILEDLFGTVKIHGELRKMNIAPLLDLLGLDDFESDLIPDILIHTPENANNQVCVIEIKTNNDVSTDQVKADLIKLNKYCEKLHYRYAYFISVNTSPNHIQNIINDPQLNLDCLKYKSRIKILCKENSRENIKIWKLDN